MRWWLLSYPELGPHSANPDHTPSNHNPNHVQGLKWALVTVDRPTHWAPSARVDHPRNTWYLILELTQTRADYCMTHSCNYAQLEAQPIKIISSLANTSLLTLLPQHRLPPVITTRHLVLSMGHSYKYTVLQDISTTLLFTLWQKCWLKDSTLTGRTTTIKDLILFLSCTEQIYIFQHYRWGNGS